jgi:hypothetical protein
MPSVRTSLTAFPVTSVFTAIIYQPPSVGNQLDLVMHGFEHGFDILEYQQRHVQLLPVPQLQQFDVQIESHLQQARENEREQLNGRNEVKL